VTDQTEVCQKSRKKAKGKRQKAKGKRRKAKGESDKKSVNMDKNELQDRLFKFAVDVIKMLRTLKGGNDLKIISNQLVKAATSSGANYEEAQAAVSRADFGYKVGISLKEMRESNYWLRILKELFPSNKEIIRLTTESFELKNILGSISIKVSPRT
jgi:four helix bundle protein